MFHKIANNVLFSQLQRSTRGSNIVVSLGPSCTSKIKVPSSVLISENIVTIIKLRNSRFRGVWLEVQDDHFNLKPYDVIVPLEMFINKGYLEVLAEFIIDIHKINMAVNNIIGEDI